MPSRVQPPWLLPESVLSCLSAPLTRSRWKTATALSDGETTNTRLSSSASAIADGASMSTTGEHVSEPLPLMQLLKSSWPPTLAVEMP